VAERMIEANGVELCTEPLGDPRDPPVLLVMGIGASMLWWEEGFWRLLAEGGRFVIRYDHRDTGRSVTYQPELLRYTGSDLVADAVGVLDAYGLVRAHVVGVSAGGRSRSCSRSAIPTACGRSSSSARLPRPAGNGAFPRRRSASATSLPQPRWIGRTENR
jgi:hypothetical protein